MEMLTKHNISETKVYFLSPDYASSIAKDKVVGRASWLINFNINSSFNAYVRDVDNVNRVRGVRRAVVPALAGASNLEPSLNQFGNTNPTARIIASTPSVQPKRLNPKDDPNSVLYEGPNLRFKMLELD